MKIKRERLRLITEWIINIAVLFESFKFKNTCKSDKSIDVKAKLFIKNLVKSNC